MKHGFAYSASVLLVLALLLPVRVQAWLSTNNNHRVDNGRFFSVAPEATDSELPPSSSSSSTSTTTATNDSDDQDVLSSLLQSVPALDFGGLQASDAAEAALAQARQHYETTGKVVNGGTATDTPRLLLGINDDVVQQVGHALGEFATQQDIQACATWLRATTSSSDMFQWAQEEEFALVTSRTDQERHQELLRQAFVEAGEVTSAFAKTFYLGTLLLGDEKARQAIWAIYVWCRRTDEIVDAPRPEDAGSHKGMLSDLSQWEARLEQLWQDGTVVDVYDLTLLQTLVQYPNLDMTPFKDMIRGMLMDVPDLGPDRYETFDDLHLYCYRVAGTVGLMSLPVFGCAPGYTDEVARYDNVRVVRLSIVAALVYSWLTCLFFPIPHFLF